MPLFSIVVPTTRAHYVRGALGSIHAQSLQDFEIVVSDNSRDGMSAVLAEFAADPRLRVVRPPRAMSVSDHWDFAFSHATGEWQLMVCDDDALVPNGLEILERHARQHPWAETMQWKFVPYRHDGPSAGRFFLPSSIGTTVKERSQPLLAEIFQEGTIPGRLKRRVPSIPLAAMRRELVAKVRSACHGRLFVPFDPMTSQCMLAMACTPEFLNLDAPLTVLGESDDSAGASVAQAGDPNSAFEQTNGDSTIVLAPIRSRRVLPNLKSETILALQQSCPALFGAYRFGWGGYFHHCRLAIDELIRQGAEVQAEERMFREALAAHPEAALELERRLAASTADRDEPPPFIARVVGAIKRRVKAAVGSNPNVRSAADIVTAAAAVGERIRATAGERIAA